ncbi:MAG: AtpZ/AtpI family protein [Cyclobacteriaceae bacterium]|nr:AtpZ/AtpI family protein [Cyclobacteriaceae bacterium]
MKYSSLGLQLAASLGLAGWAGHWLDGVMGYNAFFLLLFVSIMFAGMMYRLYRSNLD